jgi:hypothetical protein
MNVHVSGIAARATAFPDAEDGLADDFAKMLFRMSSPLAGTMKEAAERHGYSVSEGSRAFMFNAKTEDIVKFFDIGTRPSNLR